jgi:hypothetical protein
MITGQSGHLLAGDVYKEEVRVVLRLAASDRYVYKYYIYRYIYVYIHIYIYIYIYIWSSSSSLLSSLLSQSTYRTCGGFEGSGGLATITTEGKGINACYVYM